jgi:rod shape-determining protein MreC
MYTLRRWWNRYRLQLVLMTLAAGSALFIRQTNGALLFEIYHLLSRPFQTDPARQTLLSNAQTQELQQRLTELESQNRQLRELLKLNTEGSRSGIPAAVIGRSADHWWQQVILSRGSRDGVKVGYVVMTPGGVVGRVRKVSPTTSRVLLLSDPSSRVGVVISRSRYMGYLRGQAANRAVMEFFDKVPDVRRGDVVSTSALSRLFPAGLPIGRVESVNLDKSPAPEVTIALSAPIQSLEWAMIYPHSQTTPSENASDSQSSPEL